MASPAAKLICVAEYLEMEAASKEKHEYSDGEVLAMAGASFPHNEIASNGHGWIWQSLQDKPCCIYGADLKVHVETESAFVYSDLTIICNGPQFLEGRKDIVTNPSVTIEVLSEATSGYDHCKKFMRYRQIASLKEYLMIASEEMMLEHYVKNEMSNWVLTDYTKPDDVIGIATVGFEVRLQELYRGVGLGAV